MTARQLESRIGALRGSLRRLLALHGLCWVLGLIVPLVIVAGFADWLFHLDSVIRAVLLAGADRHGAVPGLSARSPPACSSDSPISISRCGSRSAGRG